MEADRDLRSFKYLYSALKPFMIRQAYTILGNHIEAEDIVTEVFISWLKRPVAFSTINEAKSYFYCCVKNASINWIKKDRRARLFKEEFGLLTKNETADYFLPQHVRKEVHTELKAVIESIPPRPKTVCKLLFYEGLSLNETAAVMNLSKNTVKNQRTSAINFLRKKVNAASVFP